ncbi:MAG: hypothetical protein ABIL11_09420 [Chloroflexota bacterium]
MADGVLMKNEFAEGLMRSTYSVGRHDICTAKRLFSPRSDEDREDFVVFLRGKYNSFAPFASSR